MALVSLPARQITRICRQICTTALTIEQAAERGDMETIHNAHEMLVALHNEYRAAYQRLLNQPKRR